MSLTKRVGLYGGAAALTLTGVCVADGTNANADNEELLSRLAAAEAKIAELESENGDNWLTEKRSEEIRSLVQDVLADGRRDQLQLGRVLDEVARGLC